MHSRDEVARLRGEAIARDQETAADQQHRIVTETRAHLGHARDRHTASGHRKHRRKSVPRCACRMGNRATNVRRPRKATTSVREDRRIGAEKTEQLAEQQRRRDPRDAGKRRMREDRHSAVWGGWGATWGAAQRRGGAGGWTRG